MNTLSGNWRAEWISVETPGRRLCGSPISRSPHGGPRGSHYPWSQRSLGEMARRSIQLQDPAPGLEEPATTCDEGWKCRAGRRASSRRPGHAATLASRHPDDHARSPTRDDGRHGVSEGVGTYPIHCAASNATAFSVEQRFPFLLACKWMTRFAGSSPFVGTCFTSTPALTWSVGRIAAQCTAAEPWDAA